MTTKTQEYAISHWPDSATILADLKKLANELPLYQIRRDKMDEYLKEFDTKFAGSKAMVEKAKELIPGGVQHNLRSTTRFRWPSTRPRARTCGTWTGTASSTSSRPAGR